MEFEIIVPKGWQKKQLQDLPKHPKKDFISGPFGSNLKASEYVEKGIPIIRLQNVDRFRFLDKNIKFLTNEKAAELKSHSFRGGDLVLTKLGSPLGKCCIVPENDKFSNGVISSDIVRITVDESRYDKIFVAYLINSYPVRKQLESLTQGSTRPRVTLQNIRNLEIALPSLPEQTRIVAKLDALFERIDKAIALLEENIKRTGELMGAVLGEVFDSLKGNCDWMPLEELTLLITKGSSPKWQGVNYVDKGLLFITSENVGSYHLLIDSKKYVDEKFNEIEPRSILRKGDILMNIVGASIGRTAIYDLDEVANINQAVCLIRLDLKKLNPNFALHFFNSSTCIDYMTDKKVDNARANLSMGNIKNFLIPVPSIEEQEKISSHLEKAKLKINSLQTEQTQKLKALQALKSSLLNQAFQGDL